MLYRGYIRGLNLVFFVAMLGSEKHGIDNIAQAAG